jgi:hypothetical protein
MTLGILLGSFSLHVMHDHQLHELGKLGCVMFSYEKVYSLAHGGSAATQSLLTSVLGSDLLWDIQLWWVLNPTTKQRMFINQR